MYLRLPANFLEMMLLLDISWSVSVVLPSQLVEILTMIHMGDNADISDPVSKLR